MDYYGDLHINYIMQLRIIQAGGGLVLNEQNELLFIFRRGSWDLPKGKVDSGRNH
jgi:hypothetical protein